MRPTARGLLAIAIAALTATACQRTKTIAFKLAPMCKPDGDGRTPACNDVDVSCVTHVALRYVDAERRDDNDQPVVLYTECREITVAPGQNLCTFGAEIGALPALPSGRPFKVEVEGYSAPRVPDGESPCRPPNRVLGGESSRAIDLDGRVASLVDVAVTECNATRCGGVAGTVIDLLTNGPVKGVQVDFGYVSLLTATFEKTSHYAATTDDAGRFALASDESAMISSSGCRAYWVHGPGYDSTVYCHRSGTPKFPLSDEVVYTVDNVTGYAAENLLGQLVERTPGTGAIVIGRVRSQGLGVEGAKIDKIPGSTCAAPPCVWYPDDDFAGLRGDDLTGKLGAFISAYASNINPNDAFEAYKEGSLFAPGKGFFLPNHRFVVALDECFGTCPR